MKSHWRSNLCNRAVERSSRHGFAAAEDLIGLRALVALNHVVLYLFAFLEALVAVTLDGSEVYENIGPTFAAQEPVAFGVVEPPDDSPELCHLEYLCL
jgi:hypothetical protein